MRSKIQQHIKSGVTILHVRPESDSEAVDVQMLMKALREGTGSIIVFLEPEPSVKALSITPGKEVTIN